jgi:hypothetical protein
LLKSINYNFVNYFIIIRICEYIRQRTTPVYNKGKHRGTLLLVKAFESPVLVDMNKVLLFYDDAFQKPFTCSLCPNGYYKPYGLKMHIDRHTGNFFKGKEGLMENVHISSYIVIFNILRCVKMC